MTFCSRLTVSINVGRLLKEEKRQITRKFFLTRHKKLKKWWYRFSSKVVHGQSSFWKLPLTTLAYIELEVCSMVSLFQGIGLVSIIQSWTLIAQLWNSPSRSFCLSMHSIRELILEIFIVFDWKTGSKSPFSLVDERQQVK